MREVLYVCEECDNEFWVPEEKAKELIRCVDCLNWTAQAFILGV